MRETQETREIVHPRPQFTRPQWMDLGGSWQFAYDDTDQGLNEHWNVRSDCYTRTIQVPFPPESPASGIGDTTFHAILWYRRTFRVPEVYKGKHLLLHCGAIDYRARVWINGQLVATHEGGHTPFSADITSVLRADEEQVIVIRAEDIPTDLAQPRGKQGWHEQPHKIWYHRTTGIWQPVWLEPVAASHLTQVRWTPDLEHGLLKMAATLRRTNASFLTLHVRICLYGEVLVDEVYSTQETEVQQDIALAHHIIQNDQWLWTPEHPHLLDATLTLYSGDSIIDEVQSYVGLRTVSLSNGRFAAFKHL